MGLEETHGVATLGVLSTAWFRGGRSGKERVRLCRCSSDFYGAKEKGMSVRFPVSSTVCRVASGGALLLWKHCATRVGDPCGTVMKRRKIILGRARPKYCSLLRMGFTEKEALRNNTVRSFELTFKWLFQKVAHGRCRWNEFLCSDG